MVRLTTSIGAGAGAGILTAVGLVAAHFDSGDPWFYLGLSVGILSGIAALLLPVLLSAVRINDAYQYGWDAGYAKGRRCASMQVVSLHRERRRRRREPAEM